MDKAASYNTIDETAVTEYKDRGSKFIAYAFPLVSTEDFKIVMNELKKDHPKATHHCFAYRIGTDGNTFRVSDAGEPSGTAGKPILGQIDSKNLTNILVIVVRYFGGTLLGVPGLIHAYKTAAALVLQLTPIVQKSIEKIYDLQFDYTQINDILTISRQCSCRIISQDIQLFCMIRIAVPVNREEETLYRLSGIRDTQVKKVN
jgi:uncharacterized YigZ family protein